MLRGKDYQQLRLGVGLMVGITEVSQNMTTLEIKFDKDRKMCRMKNSW